MIIISQFNDPLATCDRLRGFLYLQSLYHFIPDRMQSNWFSNIVHCSLAVGIVTIHS